MKTSILAILIGLTANLSVAQTNFQDIKYWIGNGPDSAMMVVDFIDGTADPSYAWGYLFDANNNETAENMMIAISSAEPKLDIAVGSGFLNDINFNSHSGTGGAPNFWGTWTKTTEWTLNAGITEILENGSIFGCSYTDFDPALAPTDPIAAYSSQWFESTDIMYWIGEGENEAILVLDFVDDLNYGIPVRYAWGYRFDGEATGQEMITDIAEADVNLDVNIDGGFLNDIIYIDQIGIGGDPDFWGTFSGTNLSDWVLNVGLSQVLEDGSWFGCTYAEWEPPRPLAPLPATNPLSFTFDDVNEWIGTGSDSAVVVIDFNDGLANEAIAFGYLFNESSTGEEALQTLSTSIENFNISMASGFLNDIVYDGHSGIGGNPNFWGTWSAENAGGWYLNEGLLTPLMNGDWFGCTYTDFSPALPPNNPTSFVVGIETFFDLNLKMGPNPFNHFIQIELPVNTLTEISLFDMKSNVIFRTNSTETNLQISTSKLPVGMYVIQLRTKDKTVSKKLVKL